MAATDVAVQGPAVDLLHLVSRRRPLGENTTCRVTGDRDQLDCVRAVISPTGRRQGVWCLSVSPATAPTLSFES